MTTQFSSLTIEEQAQALKWARAVGYQMGYILMHPRKFLDPFNPHRDLITELSTWGIGIFGLFAGFEAITGSRVTPEILRDFPKSAPIQEVQRVLQENVVKSTIMASCMVMSAVFEGSEEDILELRNGLTVGISVGVIYLRRRETKFAEC